MSARYHFVTTIELAASPQDVEDVLRDVTTWPTWWKWARRIEPLNDAQPGSMGAAYRYRVRTPLVYGFTYDTEVTDVTDGVIRVAAHGDLEGSGIFAYESDDDGSVTLTFTWMVATRKWWMTAIGPLARKIFAWNHGRLMTDFGEGLAQAVRGSLTDLSHRALDPGDPSFFTAD